MSYNNKSRKSKNEREIVKKMAPLIVTSELLAMTVLSLETPHQRFVNLLGSKRHDSSFFGVYLSYLIV
jgi:hypothetical protein